MKLQINFEENFETQLFIQSYCCNIEKTFLDLRENWYNTSHNENGTTLTPINQPKEPTRRLTIVRKSHIRSELTLYVKVSTSQEYVLIKYLLLNYIYIVQTPGRPDHAILYQPSRNTLLCLLCPITL